MTHDLVEGRSQEGIWRGKQVGIGSVWKLLHSWVHVPHLDSLGLTLALLSACSALAEPLRRQ